MQKVTSNEQVQSSEVSKIPRLRTANQIIDEYPEIGITLWYLKRLAKSGDIRVVKCGKKTLINVDYLFKFLNGETE